MIVNQHITVAEKPCDAFLKALI